MKQNANTYVSSEDIIKHLKEKNINVGLTTIYRFLNSLEKQGKVRIELREHTKYYQLILDECCDHYHLKCSKCGAMFHLECEEMQEFNEHLLKNHNFCMDSKSVIYGTCSDCMRK